MVEKTQFPASEELEMTERWRRVKRLGTALCHKWHFPGCDVCTQSGPEITWGSVDNCRSFGQLEPIYMGLMKIS